MADRGNSFTLQARAIRVLLGRAVRINSYHVPLMSSLSDGQYVEIFFTASLDTGKAKRPANILTSNQQQALQGLAGTPFVTRGHGYGPAKYG
jgi:hypothetical protein